MPVETITAVPSEWDVLSTISAYPVQMIHDSAEAVASRLTDIELCYLLASYELRRPRIIKRTLTDEVMARDGVG